MDEIAKWRDCIDSIDSELVNLLNRRATCAIEIGKVKSRLGMAIYNAEREKNVIEHAQKANQGPLDNSYIEKIFSSIIQACRETEEL